MMLFEGKAANFSKKGRDILKGEKVLTAYIAAAGSDANLPNKSPE